MPYFNYKLTASRIRIVESPIETCVRRAKEKKNSTSSIPHKHYTYRQQTTAYKIDQAVDLPRSNSHTTHKYTCVLVVHTTVEVQQWTPARVRARAARERIVKTIWLFIFTWNANKHRNCTHCGGIDDNNNSNNNDGGGGGGGGRSGLVVSWVVFCYSFFCCFFIFLLRFVLLNRGTNKANTKYSSALSSE